MRRLLFLLLLLSPSLFGYASFSGWCEQGGETVTVAGQSSVQYVQQSYPNSTQSGAGPSVTVYAAGTTNKVTLYSDAAGTSLTNPFPCSSSGQYQFFTASNMVDILFSGTGISSFTRAAIPVQEPLQFVSDLNGLTIAQNCAQAASRGATLMLSTMWDLNGTCAANIQAVSGGGFSPASGHTTTLTGTFDGDLTQHFDLSSGGSVNLASATISTIYPQWFGAKCGGNDDTAPVQNVFNSLSASVVRAKFVCQSTVTNVYVPTSAAGAIIEGMSYPVTHNAPAVGSATLLAKSGTTGAVLSIYAPAIHLKDFLVNCGPSQAANGIVLAGIIESQLDNYGAESCTDDGVVIASAVGTFSNTVMTPNAATSTTLTAQMNSGADSLTVAATDLQGMTLGGANCGIVMIEYGTANQEVLSISSVVGNTINTSGDAVFTHASGTTAQCNFNNDGTHSSSRTSTGNAGWGLDIFAGSDNNNIVDDNPTDFTNTKGGILLSGSVNSVMHGHSEGNSGPAIQMGDALTINHRSVVFSQILPFLDLENTTEAYNSVIDLCGVSNTIQFRTYTDVTFPLTGTCAALGNSQDAAFGVNNNSATGEGQFSVLTGAGLMEFQPAEIASSIGVQRGILFSSLTSVTGITINTAGSSYANGDIVTITQSGCAQAQATLTVVSTVVTAATPLAGSQGMGCAVGTALPVTGGSGSGLLLNITTIGRSNQAFIQPQDWWTGSVTVPETRKIIDYSHCQFSVSSGPISGIGYANCLGFNTSTNTGFLQSGQFGSGPKPLALNPLGGAVSIGGNATAESINYVAAECTGTNTPVPGCIAGSADNAIIIAAPITLTAGTKLTINLTHTLQAGANTIECICNGTDTGAIPLKSHYTIFNDIGTAYVGGPGASFPEVIWTGNTKWEDMSQ